MINFGDFFMNSFNKSIFIFDLIIDIQGAFNVEWIINVSSAFSLGIFMNSNFSSVDFTEFFRISSSVDFIVV